MSNNGRISAVPIGIVAVVLIALAALFVVPTWLDASRAADESALQAMTGQVLTLVSEYHSQHGRFPESLDLLEFKHFPDGATPATVEQLKYKCDGLSFTLSCPSLYGPDRVFDQNDTK
jgi:type II secretory pathway pseudopilin PulG